MGQAVVTWCGGHWKTACTSTWPVPPRIPESRGIRRITRSRRSGLCAPAQIFPPRSSRTGSGHCSPSMPTSRSRRHSRHLPVDDRGQPVRRPSPGMRIGGRGDQLDQQRSAQVADRDHHPGQDAQDSGRSMRWPTSTGPAHPTDRPRRSTGASSTHAAQHSDSETSPTTPPDHCSKPADSYPDYTLNYEEP